VSVARDAPPDPDRVIGHVRGHQSGSTVIFVAGLHGNEPAGVRALRRVFSAMPPAQQVRGEVLALAGNLPALENGTRYVDDDLNRGWWPDAVDGASPSSEESSEALDRREIITIIGHALARARGAPVVVDLHTTSSDSPPFVTLGDTLRNRRFASAVPLPLVLGLEEQLAATFLEYMNNRGCITLGCEGGRHDDPAAADYLQAIAWIVLQQAGVVPSGLVPPPEPTAFLRAAARGYPAAVEVRYRLPVPPGRHFVMRPGYRSFQRVAAGERLGHWADGPEVVAPEAGRLLMPLYQSLGDDGFFIVRDIRPIWLRVSAVLRKLRVDRIAPLLPGVSRHPYISDAVVVDRRIARWYTVEIFHLLGFRRMVEQGHEIILSRRHFDRPSDWV
jgi:predicted deacylase